jgi:hypothetical protein
VLIEPQNLKPTLQERFLLKSTQETLWQLRMFVLQSRKPPSYFRTLCDVLKVLIKFFYGEKVGQYLYMQLSVDN